MAAGLPYRKSPLIGLDRLRLVDRVPTAIHRSIVYAGVADTIGLTPRRPEAPVFSVSVARQCRPDDCYGLETLHGRPATDEEATCSMLGDEPVVMAVQRETYSDQRDILDVVDAVYDARRYAYEPRYGAIRRRPRRLAPASLKRQGETQCVEFEY